MKEIDDDEFLDDYDYPDYHNGIYGNVIIPTILRDYEDDSNAYIDSSNPYNDEDESMDEGGIEADDEYEGD